MSNKTKYIYGKQFAQKLPGSNQNFYFRTATRYEVDSNGKSIEGSATTFLYYAPKPGARTSDGKIWTPGTADSDANFNQGGWVYAGVTSDKGKTYSFQNYTQEDADLGRIPSGKKVGDPVLGATTKLSLTTSGGRFYDAVQNNLINLAVNTQPGLAQAVSAKQANVAASTAQSNTDGVSINLEDPPNQITGDNLRNWSADEDTYYYPEGIRTSKQDYIQFDILDYKTKRPDASRGNLAFQEREQVTTVLKKIILPIQPSISDSNSVDWNSGEINPVELAAVGLSGQLMNLTSKKSIDETLKKLGETLTLDDNAKKAMRLYLQQKAVGVSGLLSRFGGAILNPNMELLFQGPQLRPFTFSFRLSPREKSEAIMVRKIIRAFKESMSVKIASQELFLAAPNVYNIKYVNRYKDKDEDHPSLNKIKMCALKSCNVDYTPDGSYMTFNEPNATMASYNLTLQFQELEPVTSKDYLITQLDKNYDHIGY